MRSDIIPKSGVVKPRDNASKSRLTLGRFYRINDEREAQKIHTKAAVCQIDDPCFAANSVFCRRVPG
ncbi:MAG: hypothetical protein DME54_07670 [Verrucomicrobia bacterium]|nr:MAG: hypothetical protein DME54_07670 [Verrucomicrobiota bacterium]